MSQVNRKDRPAVYCFTPMGGWTNQQLVKNCGALPYVFYKNYGFKAVMVGARVAEYTFLDTCIKGVEMDFLPDGTGESRLIYVAKHAKDMDLVVLHGFSSVYIPMVKLYKELNPDGKIYMETDANYASQDRENWNCAEYREMLSLCDVVGASCRKIQKLLSKKWPCVVEYIPNGFYNFLKLDMSVDFSKKENIILTVGRIGTEQKCNELLLEAFGRVYKSLPHWKLQLVGSVTDRFKDYYQQYVSRFDGIDNQIEFTGIINDKRLLMEYYKKAKIFAITSVFEGGTPNVVAEALHSGCFVLTSDIDGAADATDNEKCGRIFPQMDAETLAGMLLRICPDEEVINNGARHALVYANQVMDFEKIMARLHYLLFGTGDKE